MVKKSRRDQTGCLSGFEQLLPPSILKESATFGIGSNKSCKSVHWEGISHSTLSLGLPEVAWEDLKFHKKNDRLNPETIARQQAILHNFQENQTKSNKKRKRKVHSPSKQQTRNRKRKSDRDFRYYRQEADMKAKPTFATYSIFAVFLIAMIISLSAQEYVEWLNVSAYIENKLFHNFTSISCNPDPANNGKIVHINCPIINSYKFYPAKDFSWNLDRINGLFFETEVEMFQYRVSPASFGVSASGSWSKNRENNSIPSILGIQSKVNPPFWPAVPGNGRQFPPSLVAGKFSIDPQVIADFRGVRRVPLKQDGYYKPSPIRPPSKITYYNTQALNDYLYTGDPNDPQIGDMRVSFYSSSATHISAIGVQECNAFGCSLVPVSRDDQELETKITGALGEWVDWINGSWMEDVYSDSKLLVYEGDYSGNALIRAENARMSTDLSVIWTLRVVSFIICSVVGIWSMGLSHPQKRMGGSNRWIQVLLILLSGIGCASFIECSLIIGPLWLLGSSLIGCILLSVGLIGLTISIVIGCEMTAVEYSPTDYRPLPVYEDPIIGRSSSKGSPRSNLSESSFYQAI